MATATSKRAASAKRGTPRPTPEPQMQALEPETIEPKTKGVQRHGGHARGAADATARSNSVRLCLPVVGQLELPPADELAFLGGVAVLALAGAVDWPVAVLLGAGHTLATRRRNRVVREFGEALERA